MAAAPPGPGLELCPYCRRPFKRLRSHLPHCKAAPSSAPSSAPAPNRGLGPTGSGAPGLGPAAGLSAPRSGSVSDGTGPGVGSRARAGEAGKSSKGASSPSVGQGLPGGAPREAAAAVRKGKAAKGEQGGGSSPGLGRQPAGSCAERKVEPAVEDVAKSLDLFPEEVEDLPEKLSDGVKIVIKKHRARVVREKSSSRSRGASARSPSAHSPPVEGPEPGGAAPRAAAARPAPQEGRAVPATANTETRRLGAVEEGSASSKGEKGSRKATKIRILQDPPEADGSSSPGDLIQQEARGSTVTGEKQMYLEAGVEYKAPLSALHTKNLHLSVGEGFSGHNEGTSKNDLTSIQKLRENKQQMAVDSEPGPNVRREEELAPHQFLLRTSSPPVCPCRAPGRSRQAGALGLEWFPDLHPNYSGLSLFPGKPFREDVGITVKTPKGSFSEGQQGPLCRRRLLDVRLGELPLWVATCDFSLQGLLGGVQKAWSSYYDKYINVKRGGPAGISMLLAGYCLLSYGWNYQHIKAHRWRKYH
ncbi:mitochondrial nucleoid-associated protein 1 [Leptosomus discolor]